MKDFFLKYKYIFYISNTALIILYLSPCSILGYLLNNDCKLQPQLTSDFIISTNHLYAFLLLSIIGFLTFKGYRQLKILKIYLIFLSVVLEISHIYISTRSFEFTDLFGNLIGVLIVILVSYLFKKNENIKN